MDCRPQLVFNCLLAEGGEGGESAPLQDSLVHQGLLLQLSLLWCSLFLLLWRLQIQWTIQPSQYSHSQLQLWILRMPWRSDQPSQLQLSELKLSQLQASELQHSQLQHSQLHPSELQLSELQLS